MSRVELEWSEDWIMISLSLIKYGLIGFCGQQLLQVLTTAYAGIVSG